MCVILQIIQVQEKEEQASKDFIKNILEEEQALQLQQEKEDEKLARKLSGQQTQVLYNFFVTINRPLSKFSRAMTTKTSIPRGHQAL